MFRVCVLFLVALVAVPTSEGAFAQDPRITVTVDQGLLPPAHRVEGGLHLTAREAHRAVSTLSGVVLIDVRTHEETLFNGVASPMHRHIPYVIADFDHSYDTERERYRLEPNPYFPRSVDELLAEMKLDREATIILYCSVGERSARAANLLIQSGFKSVYSMVEGFEGDPASGIGAGWKAAGLPWTQRLRRDQAYKNPAM